MTEGHHTLSHHAGDKNKLEKIKKIDKYYIELFAHFLEKLAAVKEEKGTILDNSMIVYGGALSDGNRHNHDDLPILLAGQGGGTLKTGRHVRYAGDTPLNNLWLSMLERMDVKIPFLGDSSGMLNNLT